MKKQFQLKRPVAMLLALIMIFSLIPVHAHATTEDTIYVLAGSDFQPTDGSTGTGVTLLNKILNKVDDQYTTMDGFLFAGDYDYNYNASQAGKEALQDAVQAVYGTGMDEIYVQGNHDADSLVGSVLTASGANDTDNYGVFVINEKDYMWYNDNEATIKATAENLKTYLNAKRNAGYTKPIFVVSHLPLHYCMRTQVGGGDGKHANYIFDVLNEAGAAGLNIIFMFGHNHSHGWDDPYGGAAIFLTKGDSINIAQNSTTNYNVETLNFTYMNAGYISYYRHVNSNAETDLSMTVFAITDSTVTIERYTADGLHDLKSAGVANKHATEGGSVDGSCSSKHGGTETYSPDTSVVASAYTLTLNTEITPAGEEETTPDDGTTEGRTYTRVTAASELVSGGQYLIIHNGQNDFMAPVVTSDGGTRIGYDLVTGPTGLGDDRISGEYQEYEWTFTSTDGGWLIGAADGYMTFQAADSRVAAQLTETGDTMVIGGSANNFTFTSATYSNGSYVLNYNSTGDLINGYASNAAAFYIYQMTNEGGEEEDNGSAATIRQVMSYDELKENVGYLIVADEGEDITLTNQVNGSGLLLSGSVSTDNVHLWYLDLTNEYIRYGSATGSDNFLKVTNGGSAIGNSTDRVTEILDNGDGTFSLYRGSYYLNRYGGSTSTKAGGYNQNNSGSRWKLYEVVPAEHQYETVTVAPTCTEDGSVTYTCTVCGDSYSEVIAATGHSYEAVVTAPTCTEGGYTTYTCECGDSYVADEVAALGHTYASVTTEATCTADGCIVYTCACGDTYTEVLPALSHSYEAVVTAPTCTEGGYTTYTCECGDSYVADEVAALGHDYESVTVAPTCTENGYTGNTCVNCGETTVTDETPALGHEYTAVVTEATCETAGYTTYTCHCGDSYVADEVAALGHVNESVITEATCETAGFTTHTCTVCGKETVDSHVAALGHAYETATVEATCVVDGSVTRTCGRCGETSTEVISALGHIYESVVTAPTCTEGGYTTYTCHCGDSYVADEVAALGHTYETVTVNATCTADGSVTYTCACGDTYTEMIAATGHDYEAVVTEPTCETAGYTTYVCACGDSYVADEVAALGHDYEAVVTEPTCETAGYTTYVCACGDSYVADEVAALGHSYTAVEENGYMVYTCDHCGHSYSEKLTLDYSQTSAFVSGDSYVITVKSGSTYYALSHANNTISTVKVTVSDGKITSEVSEDLLWDYANGKLSYISDGTTRYLYIYTTGWWFWTTPNLGISTSESAAVSISGTQLKVGSYYLRYSSSKIGASSRAGSAYIFVEA